MANKPFAIQGANLTLGGVNLQAGTTGVVIPGITQAANYKVEEVEDTGDQTLTFQAPPFIIDYVTFNDYDNNGTSTSRAEYSVEELDDDDFIDGIAVNENRGGVYTLQESEANAANDLYAYTGSAQDPFATFVAGDWDQIPFRPKMRAGVVETIGGGGGVDGLSANTDFEPDSEGDTRYELLINEDIELATYQSSGGGSTLGPGFSLGQSAGSNLSSGAIAIGNNDTGYKAKNGGVYIGYAAGYNNEEDPQGEYAIAIGAKAAYNFAQDNSITLNATGVALDPTADGLYIKPVREDTGNTAKAVYYDTTSGELTYADPTGGGGNANTGDVVFNGSTLYVAGTGFLTLDNLDNQLEIGTNGPYPAKLSLDEGATAWYFNTNGSITFPDDTVQTTAYTGGGGGSGITDEGNVVITAGSTEHWLATQRRNDDDTFPKALRYDTQGNLYSLTLTDDGITVITKYTAAGSVAWQKSFTNAYARALTVDSSDCAYVTMELGGPTVTIVKFGSTGTILWKKDYDLGPIPAFDAFIEEKSSTTLAVAFSMVANNNFPDTALVMEISATDGAVQIKKSLTLTDQTGVVFVSGIDVDPDENVFVTGYYQDPAENGKAKMFIEKLDQDLVRVWTKSLETDNSYDMYGGDCASDGLGNIYAVGTYNVDTTNSENSDNYQSASILTKLNSSGVVQWTRRIGPGPCGSFGVGLTATAAGNVYLSAVTFAKKTDGVLIDADEYEQESYGDNKLLVARYNTQGDVIWQRYVDLAHLYESYDEEGYRGQAIAVFGDKFAIDGYGTSTNTVPFNSSGTNDNEYDYFVAQLPTDGTALTIGDLDFTESRVPGRFITHTTATSPLNIATFSTAVTTSDSNLVADAEARIANNIVKSEPYEYTFGADGTLTIPNDGDLRLTQTQVGYLMSIGGSLNNNSSIYGRAVVVDSQGNMYVAGEDNDEYQPFITKIDPNGVRVWGITIDENDNGDNGRVNGITINPTSGNLMVVCEFYSSYDYSVLFTIDQDTGRILDNQTFKDDADVLLVDIAYTDTVGDSTSSYVMAGSKNSEFTPETALVKQTGSGTGVIKILRSSVDRAPDTNWQIGGTGFSAFEYLLHVERYTGLTGTVRQGSGATFNIVIDGSGAITESTVNAGGTNYLVGHKILINHAVFDGNDNNSDVIITVTEATNGVIGAVAAGYYGSGGGAPGTYTAASGTNTQVGSGFTFEVWGPTESTDYSDSGDSATTAGGSNYVAGDVIVVSGTSLGGTSPANDLTVVVNATNGVVDGINALSGTSQSTTWKLETTTQVDFSGSGSWTWTRPLSRQNLLVTSTWQRTFGTDGNQTDRLYAVAIDSVGNIITVGEGYGTLFGTYKTSLAMVYKFNSTGTLEWSRQLNQIDSSCYAKSVVTVGTDIYVTHYSPDGSDTVITKLNASGVVKWQRITDSSDDSVIAATQDGNLLVSVEAYETDIGQTALKVFLLSPSGETIYQRWLYGAADEDTQFKNGRGLVVDGDSFYITAYVYANNYRSTLAARLPVDGSGTGEYGSFRYAGVNAMSGSFSETGLTDINYDINAVDLEGQYNYAGALTNGADPYVNENDTVTEGTWNYFGGEEFYPDLTTERVRDTDGGRIVFADGTTQNTSATDIPQRRYTGQRYTLGLKDRGHHILCNNENDDNIIIPYNARVPFPIGTVITIVNDTGGNVTISAEGGGTVYLMLPGEGSVQSVNLENYGIATLLKIYVDGWVISGNVTVD